MNNSTSNNYINNTNSYRPTSFSEGHIYNIKNNPSNISNLTESLLEIDEKVIAKIGSINANEKATTESFQTEQLDEEIQVINKKCCSDKVLMYSCKRSIMFMLHLGLISLFEIIFFFNIVSVYEDNALINIMSTFTQSIPGICTSLNVTDKEIFTYVFRSFVNIKQINYNAQNAFEIRNKYNSKLVLISWMYFLGVIVINLILLICKFFLKFKINLVRIFFDNIIMIILLGLYEFLFFRTVILQYQSISTEELTKTIVNQFTNCVIGNNTI
jgi:hypothetical protein